MGLDLGRSAEVDRGRGVHADPGVAMFVVVGGEEPLTERAGIGQDNALGRLRQGDLAAGDIGDDDRRGLSGAGQQ